MKDLVAEIFALVQASAAAGARQVYLRHVVVTLGGDQHAEVQAWTYDAGDDNGASRARAIAAEAVRVAEEDAAATGGAQRFVVHCERDDGKIVGRRQFTVAGKLITSDTGPTDGPPNVAMLVQAHRYVESLQRANHLKDQLIVGLAEKFIAHAKDENAALREEVTRLRQRELDVSFKVVELLDTRAERDAMLMRTQKDVELRSKTYDQVVPALAAVLGRVSGVPMVPKNVEAPIDALLLSLSGEQLSAIDGIFTPEQKVAFFTIANERKSALEAAARKQAEQGATSAPANDQQQQGAAP